MFNVFILSLRMLYQMFNIVETKLPILETLKMLQKTKPNQKLIDTFM